jgi:tetratricopeptide (TPR) repeat protein
MRALLVLLLVMAGFAANANDVKGPPPAEYQRALELIHAFSGSGDQLMLAMQLADGLANSHPKGGYAETLRAEALSTWRLNQQGQPAELRTQIIALAEQALRVNPNLAQAHVAIARTFLRASEFDQANAAVDAALKLDPGLNGAMFIRADIFRRTDRLVDAEAWYLKFIAATPDKPRQSNGYYWLGRAYQEAAYREPARRSELVLKARTAYEKMLELESDGAWRNVNFAVFLNSDAGDFDAAEQYAAKALSIMDFPMARYHLAIARYQKLGLGAATDDAGLWPAMAKIQSSTGISFQAALEFSGTYPAIRERLQAIWARAVRTASPR